MLVQISNYIGKRFQYHLSVCISNCLSFPCILVFLGHLSHSIAPKLKCENHSLWNRGPGPRTGLIWPHTIVVKMY